MGESSWESDKERITKANNCSLESIFKFYGININKNNTKSVCPFKNHKGGRENSASFYFYPDTNTFWCFGCKIGTRPIDFVMNYDSISFHHAIDVILNLNNIKFIKQPDVPNHSEKLFELNLKLSELIYKTKDYESMKVFDDLNIKYNLDDEAKIIVLNKIINKMEGKCQKY